MSGYEKELNNLIVERAFRVVPLNAVQTDWSYQRPLKKTYKNIVKKFNQDAFGIPVIAQRKDKTLWVIDGQQRLAAARDLGWTEVRAEVVSSDGPVHEAEIFNIINMNRRKLNNFEQYKALLVSGDHAANLAKQTCEKYGFEIIEGARSRRISPEVAFTRIVCVKTILDSVSENGVEPLSFALDMLNKCWKPDPVAVNSVIITGLMEFYLKHKDATAKYIERCAHNWKMTPPNIVYQQAATLASAKRTSPANCSYDVLFNISKKRPR